MREAGSRGRKDDRQRVLYLRQVACSPPQDQHCCPLSDSPQRPSLMNGTQSLDQSVQFVGALILYSSSHHLLNHSFSTPTRSHKLCSHCQFQLYSIGRSIINETGNCLPKWNLRQHKHQLFSLCRHSIILCTCHLIIHTYKHQTKSLSAFNSSFNLNLNDNCRCFLYL